MLECLCLFYYLFIVDFFLGDAGLELRGGCSSQRHAHDQGIFLWFSGGPGIVGESIKVLHICIHIHTYMYIYTHIYNIYVYIYMYIYMYVCVCKYLYDLYYLLWFAQFALVIRTIFKFWICFIRMCEWMYAYVFFQYLYWFGIVGEFCF